MIESSKNNNLYEETFLFTAIKNSNTFINNNEINIIKEKNKTETNTYTIQVASWPNLDQAVRDKEELISNGYDAYIEKYTNEEKKIARWRVRIGSFEDKNLASKIKKDLSVKRGKDIWIDKIK